MHSAHNMSLLLIITDSAKILHAYDEIFLGKCGIKRSRFGSLQCLKYNRMGFSLNSNLTSRFITEINNSKIPCIQQIGSDTWWEKGHTVKSYKKQDNLITKSFCHPNERCEIMLRLTLPPYLIHKKAKISQKL